MAEVMYFEDLNFTCMHSKGVQTHPIELELLELK